MKSIFGNYLRAGYPALWFLTNEEQRAIEVLSKQIPEYRIYKWDTASMLQELKWTANEDGEEELTQVGRQEIESQFEIFPSILSLPAESVVFLFDFHVYFEDITIKRMFKTILKGLKASDRHVVFISPVINIPVELEKDITVLDFPLPTIEELKNLATEIVKQNNLTIDIPDSAIKAMKGLTMEEAENAAAKSIIENRELNYESIEQEKLQMVKKSGLAEIWTPVSMNEIGGQKPIKAYIQKRKEGFFNPSLPTPRGIILTGLPGSGKSLFAKAVASVLGFPLIKGDFGTLKGGIVGESEKNMTRFTQLCEAVAPAVIMFDEGEKAIAGAQSSGKTDGGSTANMFAQFLTWYQETTAEIYVVMTCNDMDPLLDFSQGALLRRFDDIFFMDLPGKEERKEILAIHKKKYNSDLDYSKVDTSGWTGAEIEKMVKNSLFDGVEIAASNIRPIAIQNKEKIDRARDWARYNAIPANEPDSVENGKGKRTLKM